jgi:hypothetical protein
MQSISTKATQRNLSPLRLMAGEMKARQTPIPSALLRGTGHFS